MGLPRATPRGYRALAWGLCASFAAMAAGTVVLVMSGSGTADQALVVLAAGFAVVGALIASREPGNAVGWLMLAITTASAFQGLIDAYYLGGPGRPGEAAAAWVASWVWFVWLYLATLTLPLVFPNGRLLSRRWRVVLWMGFVALALAIVSAGLTEGPIDVGSPQPLANPFGVGGPAAALVSGAGVLGNALAVPGFVLGGICLLQRLRSSRGRERQQVKWFVYVGALTGAALVLSVAGGLVADYADGAPSVWGDAAAGIGWITAFLLILVGLPAAVGTAILRHRLYDIDVVIKRTLVYGSLTLLLVSTYLALVLGFRVLLSPVTGESDLAVATSTLAVAGLFRPARTRIQQIVDRRFYRRRYDATLIVESFTGRLRQEVDLQAVSADLDAVVRGTMQPAHLSLWLRRTG